MIETIKKLPKVELHVHLDGSVRPSTVAHILKLELEDVKKQMIVDMDNQDLNTYLDKFDLPIKAMQEKENLIRIASEFAEDLKQDNVIYYEVRFAPIKHIEKNLTLEEVIESVQIGLNKIDIPHQIILCMMRDSSLETNEKIIMLAKKYQELGVGGIDLAGAEAIYPTSQFENLFKKAKQENVSFTIHAGEADGKDSILSALSFQTKRLGHGIKAIEDRETLKKIKENNILLEICPTSNLQTQAVKNYVEHPLKWFYDDNIPICINTDNRTVSNVTLNQEYQKLHNAFGFKKEDFIKMNIDAVRHAFLKTEEKEKLIQKLTHS